MKTSSWYYAVTGNDATNHTPGVRNRIRIKGIYVSCLNAAGAADTRLHIYLYNGEDGEAKIFYRSRFGTMNTLTSQVYVPVDLVSGLNPTLSVITVGLGAEFSWVVFYDILDDSPLIPDEPVKQCDPISKLFGWCES